jgi:DnaJ-class molecular chaperone
MPRWVKKAVDQGFIMSYKTICDNCNGNGHINITDSKGKTETKQCWICNSEGEIKYEKDFINKLINDHHHRLQ